MYEKLIQRLDHLSEKGNQCRYPTSEHIEDGLFELRGRAKKKQARLIFYFKPNKMIVFVHAFYKPGNKISPDDIAMAKKNRKTIEENQEKIYGLNYTN